MDSSSLGPGVWGAHDLVAALVIRDRVHAGAQELGSGSGEKLQSVLREVDQKFLAITEKDDRGRLVRLSLRDDNPSGWWWYRIPTHGPAREEIDHTFSVE